ncbi:hypothetical protein, partial [Nocardia xishanensis]
TGTTSTGSITGNRSTINPTPGYRGNLLRRGTSAVDGSLVHAAAGTLTGSWHDCLLTGCPALILIPSQTILRLLLPTNTISPTATTGRQSSCQTTFTTPGLI